MRVKLLEYFITRKQIIAFLFGKDREMLKVATLPMGLGELGNNAKRFIKNINLTLGAKPDEPLRAGEWSGFCDGWGKELLGCFADDILDETDILYIVPHHVIHRLPLHAVRINGKYLCEKVAVCYIPGPAILRRCQLQNKARRLDASYKPENCLSVGCDLLSNDTRKQEEFCQFAREVAGHFSQNITSVLTGPCSRLPGEELATVENVEKICRESELDLLSFFCHGAFKQDDPLSSVLYLLPNGITALEIMSRLYINAGLVTLIGCTTAEPDIRQGDEVYSLSMAMIFSGAATVTGALWRAHAPAAHTFFDRFISSWRAGASKAFAFQEAQKEMIHSEKFSHPYHWAPYVFIGDWV